MRLRQSVTACCRIRDCLTGNRWPDAPDKRLKSFFSWSNQETKIELTLAGNAQDLPKFIANQALVERTLPAPGAKRWLATEAGHRIGEPPVSSFRQGETKLAFQAPADKVANAGGDPKKVGGLRGAGVFDVTNRVKPLEFPSGGGKAEREFPALLVGHAIDSIGALDKFLGDLARNVGVRLAPELAQCADGLGRDGTAPGNGKPCS